jgi:hypothetical protein
VSETPPEFVDDDTPPPDVDTTPREEDGPQPHQEPMYVEVEVTDEDAVEVES